MNTLFILRPWSLINTGNFNLAPSQTASFPTRSQSLSCIQTPVQPNRQAELHAERERETSRADQAVGGEEESVRTEWKWALGPCTGLLWASDALLGLLNLLALDYSTWTQTGKKKSTPVRLLLFPHSQFLSPVPSSEEYRT